ncbi:erythrocyte membrane protein 1, PfEMP1, putative [Plasmodium reichenowi]|uniref:Erythrocyte membrane protein 1, PfEMP1, putative n=1 Tax=Plasmodium reichenowi TaxID=5854 RepID=A0A2P9D7G2_PLARE|nr:erythrocyte membrane protein 1, PfEMP1, putative [Plasmodium reichenowi]
MAPTAKPGGVGGGNGYSDATDAKHLLDMIGETVHGKLHTAALEHVKGLKGLLSKAEFPKDEGNDKPPTDACKFNYEYDTNVRWGVIDPCEHKSEERFSEVSGGECDDEKIEGNTKGSNCGVCAPFRRLHVCDRNLEKITDENTTNTHNLLVDVLLAAKYEGASIRGYYTKYQQKYGDSDSTMCTMLARSFADIGDIIRGKDLFLGYDQKDKEQKQKLQQNLKEIFKKIHGGLTNRKAKTMYQGDGPNYYKLREDWWEHNRQKVWKALTCHAPEHAKYFRGTCGGNEKTGTLTHKHCRCLIGDVPTYFDYVPQFLRWFEEWAEDFCRKKKKKVEYLDKQCRGESNDKYCDRNGYDCKETVRGKNILITDPECTKCSVACAHFVPWIGNQQKEFDKQKNKYVEEIKKAHEKTQASDGKINSIYEKEFYKELEKEYKTLDKFLQKLNDETICKGQTKVGKETANHVDFKNEDVTFSHRKYCDTCPWCAKKEKGTDGNWIDIQETGCETQNEKKINNYNTTDIKILAPDRGVSNILDKYNKLCKNCNNDKPTETWQCHYEEKNEYDESSGNDYCVLQNGKTKREDQTIKPYETFFEGWVTEMLDDSIIWRKEHGKCINNKEANNCMRDCKTTCECFLKWVKQKEEEWDSIKGYYDLQKNMNEDTDPYITLKYYLQETFMEKIKEAYGEDNAKELEKKLNSIKGYNGAGDTQHSEEAIKVLLDHEEEIANKCIANDQEKNCKQKDRKEQTERPKQPIQPAGRSDSHEEIIPIQEEEEEEEIDDPDDGGDGAGEAEDTEQVTTELTKTEETTTDTTQSDVNVCEIVEGALNVKTLEEACPTKYENGREKFPNWKCIPTNTTTTGGSEGVGESKSRHTRSVEKRAPSDSNQGGLCIPPRRRRLYLHDLKTLGGDEATGGAENTPTQKQLLEWFVKSAAVETFFLWHNYKERWKLENGGDEVEGPKGGGFGAGTTSTVVGPFVTSHSEMRASSSLHPPAGPHPPTGGSLQPTPPLLPVPPGFPPGPQIPVPSPGVGLNGRSTSLLQDGSEHGYFGTGSGEDSGENQTPEQQLEKGKIPNDFLRQMFYTLADYRDICIGGDRDVVGDTIISNTSDKDANSSGEPKTVSKIIEDFLKKQPGDKATSGISTGSPSDKDPKTWWDKNAKHIWEGMVCALTYEEKDPETVAIGVENMQKIVKIENPENLWDSGKNEPKNPKYQYGQVQLDEEEEGGQKTNNPTTLKDFVLRPPYFRYLEEWGETFCRERAKRLKQIKVDCEQGGKPCSGDGFNCDDESTKKEDIFKHFNCSTCAGHCRYYKKWIRRKKDEYEKQSNAYTGQQKKSYEQQKNCENERNGGAKEFCEKLEENAAGFLERLKNGPCKTNNGDDKKGDGNEKDILDFSKPEKTFQHAQNCKPCSEFKVNCNGSGNCTGDGTQGKCNGKTYITAKDIEKNPGSTVLDMRVSDNSGSGNGNKFENGLTECKDAGIFKGFRKDEWKCRNVCGVDICTLEKTKNGNGKEHITVKEFLKRWLETFFDDYNRIRTKLKACKENGKGSPCFNDCTNKCKCVKEWIGKKRTEWENINNTYKEVKENKNDAESNNLSSFLEVVPFRNEVDKAIKPCQQISDFYSKRCNANASSKKSEDSTKYDGILCLLNKLEKKVTNCKDQHNENTVETSGENPEKQCQNTPPLPDEEEETEENTVEHPKICGDMKTTKETVDDGGCEPADEKVDGEKDSKEEREENGPPLPSSPPPEQTPVLKPEEEAPASEKSPEQETKVETKKEDKKQRPPRGVTPPPTVFDNPHVQTALASNALMWSIGIAITGLSYWFLKKKSKSPVDFFSVLEIPQNDYGMPTKLSSNRYIPYKSAQYRGKRYIYIEGDSGTDSGYTDHYSDITSSSESEYEEFDINDIYVPGSPKYKTLIEVVLEPSKRDTTNTPNDIPSGDISSNTPNTPNNIPNTPSGTTPPITDDEWNQLKKDFISNMLQNEQNDIPNDYTSGDIPMNTHPKTLYFDKPEEKPFITSIHDRNLYTGEEISYDMSTKSGQNNLYSGIDPKSGDNVLYSGIDLINDALSGDNHDIYNELLKRKENELFGTNHVKQTSTHSVAKPTNSDPITNQLELFHKWLDRHRNMCEQWNNKEELLDKLKELWENETHSGNKPSDNTTRTSDKNKHSDNHVLNTDVSIQINMNDPKPINQYTNMYTNPHNSTMDTILDDLDKTHNEPYYYDFYKDDIYYDVNDQDASTVNSNNMDVPSKVKIEMSVKNTQMMEEKYPIGDVWDI